MKFGDVMIEYKNAMDGLKVRWKTVDIVQVLIDVIDFIQYKDTEADGICGQHEITQQETW